MEVFRENGNQESRSYILISDKIDFQSNSVIRDKEGILQ